VPGGRTRSLVALLLASAALATAAGAATPVRSFIRAAGPADATRTLILVNGGPGYDSQQIFRAFRRLTTPTRRVVAYDQRGVGRTPAPRPLPQDYSLDAFVADLEALRIRLGVERIDLLGHSFGALVASAYTATHPRRVRSLILHSGLPLAVEAQYEGDARFEQRLVRLQRRGTVPSVVPERCAVRSRALLPVYVADPRRAAEVRSALGPFRCDDDVGTIANESIVSGSRRDQLGLALARYRGPALVVMGARDPFGSAWADDNAAPLRNARVTKRILPNAGHFLWLESPALFPTLRAFLATT
jgi:proline iminopeptidase